MLTVSQHLLTLVDLRISDIDEVPATNPVGAKPDLKELYGPPLCLVLGPATLSRLSYNSQTDIVCCRDKREYDKSHSASLSPTFCVSHISVREVEVWIGVQPPHLL